MSTRLPMHRLNERNIFELREAVRALVRLARDADDGGRAKGALESLSKGQIASSLDILQSELEATKRLAVGSISGRSNVAEAARRVAVLALFDDRNRAIEALTEATNYAPQDAWSWICLARAEAQIGRQDAARSSLQNAIVSAETSKDQYDLDLVEEFIENAQYTSSSQTLDEEPSSFVSKLSEESSSFISKVGEEARHFVRNNVGIFSFFRTSPPQRSADQAKERLQVLLALERSSSNQPSFLPQLQEDILKVVAKYVQVDNDKILIEVERGPDISMLDINIELPASASEKSSEKKSKTKTFSVSKEKSPQTS
ncbi:MAG: cell division topological specificity factor MinE [Pseudomonadota bacterium]